MAVLLSTSGRQPDFYRQTASNAIEDVPETHTWMTGARLPAPIMNWIVEARISGLGVAAIGSIWSSTKSPN
jgi:hypothetical protein